MDQGKNQVLFICTGNYYRSRFAEAVFNGFAQTLGLRWAAISRGLNIAAAPDDPLSPHTESELGRLGLDRTLTGPDRVPLRESDLAGAQHVIALKETEHRPMMERQFPHWVDRIEYWEVHDLDRAGPEEALPEIYQRVQALAAGFGEFERAGVS